MAQAGITDPIKDVRVPISFTSTLRSYLRGDGDVTRITEVVAKQEKLTAAVAAGTYLTNIEMLINPSSIQWTQPKRVVPVNTQGGTVFFHFGDKDGRDNDILTLAFTGSTGNIDPRATDTLSNQKWLIWHNLYQLSREPIALADGTENIITIDYSSSLFPGESGGDILSLYGYFENVMSFTETADKPNSRDYSFSFKVIKTEPDLNSIINLMEGFGSPIGGYDRFAETTAQPNYNPAPGESIF
tara:strand:- start:2793 stop:3521 length:729 start_codon:yes stop_codon:yes gene_type:complete